MNIVLCDDDNKALEKNKALLDEIFARRQLQYAVRTFSSGEELVAQLPALSSTDLFVLDYKMKKLSGMDVAKIIREHGLSCKIVFISSVVEAAPKGYEMGVYRYVLKDRHMERNFTKCVDRIIDDYKAATVSYTFHSGRLQQTVLAKDILYVESQNHKIRLHMAPGRGHPNFYESYNTLADVEQTLSGSNFFRIIRHCIVNLKYVETLLPPPDHFVVLKNGVKLPISRTNNLAIRKKLMVWLSDVES